MDSNTNCGKSSATKKLKGFTLIELIVVIAIIAILAGISSLIVGGFVRDARLETARNIAQEVYTGIQNTLVQMEIKQEANLLNPSKYPTKCTNAKATSSNYITLHFVMDSGTVPATDDFVIADGKETESTASIAKLDFGYPDVTAAADDDEKNFRKLAKYLTDNLAMDFSGYVYAAIDMENWVVDSVVYVDDYNKVKNSTNGINDFVPNWCTKSGVTASADRVPFCDSIIQQKQIYSGEGIKEDGTNMVDASNTAVGFYPFLGDLNGTTVSCT